MFEVKKLNIYADVSSGVTHIVKDVSFKIDKGETLAIVGESGSGKTMTAMSIIRLLPSNCRQVGEIYLDGEEISDYSNRKYGKLRGKDIVFIPQSGAEFLDNSFTVKSQMREIAKNLGLKNKKEIDDVCISKLKAVELQEAEKIYRKYPFQLSGGMAQKVTLALSSIADPKLVIADEATRGIDEMAANAFLDNMDSLFNNACKIIITHNMDIAKRADYILVMKKGVVVEYAKTTDITHNPKNEYTKALLKAKEYEAFYD